MISCTPLVPPPSFGSSELVGASCFLAGFAARRPHAALPAWPPDGGRLLFWGPKEFARAGRRLILARRAAGGRESCCGADGRLASGDCGRPAQWREMGTEEQLSASQLIILPSQLTVPPIPLFPSLLCP